MSRTLVVLAVAILGLACESTAPDPLGCYQVVFGPGAPAGSNFDKLLRLRDEKLMPTDLMGLRAVRPSPDSGVDGDFLLKGSWWLALPDSLLMATGGFFVGLTWRLRRGSPPPRNADILVPTWSGLAHMWTDTPPIGEWTAPVSLFRAACLD